MSGLSPATFGYEKDSYINTANVELSANATEMTIESIKTQLTNQLSNLFENIVKMQVSQKEITENLLRVDSKIEWNYGDNERLDDDKKLKILKELEGVAEVPYYYKARIIEPLIKKLTQESDEKFAQEIMDKRNIDRKGLEITYGEL